TGAVLAVPLEWLAVQAADPAALLDGGLADAATGATGVAAALTVAGVVLGAVGSRSGGPSGWLRWPGIALAVASLAVVGHTRTYQPTWLVVGADLAHVLAGALWSGGLLALLLWWRSERGPDDVLTVVSRFSTAAAVSVLVLAATGTTMAVLVLERWSDVLQTAYGRALLVKLALVAVVLAMAGWNRLVLVPRLRRAEAAEVAPRLRRSMVDEVALLAAVAVFTGVLTSASPVPDDHDGHGSATAIAPAPQRLDLGDVEAEVLLSPARRGPNDVAVTLRDDTGPVEVEQAPTVSLTLPGQVGPLTTRLEPTGTPGQYRGPVDLPLAGRWELAVAVRLDRFTEPVGVVTVDVP
uniref:CopD family protein n=1 Tax=Desertihabitans aurantiacus TaxID=2282477 RepID=UPI0018E514CE